MTSNLERITDTWFDDLLAGNLPLEQVPISNHEKYKLFFLGNHPAHAENPTLHFLITPMHCRLESWTDFAPLLYFHISPSTIEGTLVPEGKIHQVTTKKTYLLLERQKKGRDKYLVLPFQTENSFPYKIITDTTFKNLGELCTEQYSIKIREHCFARNTLPPTPEDDTRKQHFLTQLDDTYQYFKRLFKEEFNTTKPLSYRTLRPKDWAKQKVHCSPSSLGSFFKNMGNAFYSLFKDHYIARFDEQSFWHMKCSIETEESRKVLEDTHLPLYQAGARTSTAYGLITIATSCFNSILIAGMLTHPSVVPENPTPSFSVVCGFLLADLLTSCINFAHSYSSTSWGFAPGLIGTLREMCKKDNFYDKTSRIIS